MSIAISKTTAEFLNQLRDIWKSDETIILGEIPNNKSFDSLPFSPFPSFLAHVFQNGRENQLANAIYRLKGLDECNSFLKEASSLIEMSV